MINKILGLFRKKDPYWNEFYLKYINAELKSDGFEALMQNIKSDAAPFEDHESTESDTPF